MVRPGLDPVWTRSDPVWPGFSLFAVSRFVSHLPPPTHPPLTPAHMKRGRRFNGDRPYKMRSPVLWGPCYRFRKVFEERGAMHLTLYDLCNHINGIPKPWLI